MDIVSVSLTCGGIGKENTTYFESSGTEVGQCRVKICKCQPNVCQLRLDFNTFIIAGPSTSVTSVGLSAFGVLEVAGALPVSTATQCLTDQFSVTNPNGAAPPVICGTNTGEHMVCINQMTLILDYKVFFSMCRPVICAQKQISNLVTLPWILGFLSPDNG